MRALAKSLTIENVVGVTELPQELGLAALAADLDGARYDPELFPGIIYRLDDPPASCLLYRSGSIVCTGAGSIAECEQAVHRLFDALRPLDVAVPADLDLSITNIVTSGDLGQPLDLSAIAVGLGLEHTEYEPEDFPGLVYRLPERETVSLLFASGKVIITGATHPTDAEITIEEIYEDLDALGLLPGES